MALDLVNYEELTRRAVQVFWETRESARLRQQASGRMDQGERSGVTSGKNMDGFLEIASKIVVANGLAGADIHTQRRVLTLPGYFRPTKLWDMLVTYKGELVAAVEFKSQVGPSFGNNFNNRTEEAIGTAHDLWTAYREEAFGKQPRPFVGWLILVEDAPASRSEVKENSPHYAVFDEFRAASYLDRYNILCQKLVKERLYSAATLIASSRDAAQSGDYSELSPMSGMKTFVTGLAGHIASAAARLS